MLQLDANERLSMHSSLSLTSKMLKTHLFFPVLQIKVMKEEIVELKEQKKVYQSLLTSHAIPQNITVKQVCFPETPWTNLLYFF